jgi:putative sigma-54 modulation protein
VEKYRQTAEIKVKVYKETIAGRADSDDMYASIEMALDKIKRQLKKYKGKLKDKRPEEISDAVEKITKPETDVDAVDM